MEKKELNKKIKRLLQLSDQINDKMDILASLSYHDKEGSDQYEDHYASLKNYMYQETIILNNLSIDDLEAIFKTLPKYDDGTDTYNRLHIIIDDKISEYYIKRNEQKPTEEEYMEESEEDDEEIPEEISEEELTEEEKLAKYYRDEEDIEKYAGIVTDNIAIKVLKQLQQRIKNTLAENKTDEKYKKKLIRELKSFKYFVLSIDRNLENIGINYRFNIDAIPEGTNPIEDIQDICHNNSINIILRMYEQRDIEYEPTIQEELLFNSMCFDEYLKYLDEDSLEKLLDLCNELSKNGKSFYGETIKQKIKAKIKAQ